LQAIKYVHDLGELFDQVQLSGLFGDSKTFPDCRPKTSLFDIKMAYENTKNSDDFSLQSFVKEYFDEPVEGETVENLNQKTNVTRHINNLWAALTRHSAETNTSLLNLPKQYVVPGGRFREVYYWDSYFTMLGLEVSGHYTLIESMVENFAHLLDTYGLIPNGNRAYYLGRSQPPFFALMIDVLAKKFGQQIYIKYLPQLVKEFEFWQLKRSYVLDNNHVIYRYYDDFDSPRPEAYKEDVELSHRSMQKPEALYRNLRAAAESGWDFSSRWFANAADFGTIQTTSIMPVDLNCLVLHLIKTIGKAYTLMGANEKAQIYEYKADKLLMNIQKYCWNNTEGFYFDYNFIAMQQTDSQHLAACFPLFLEIATPQQAKKVAEKLKAVFLQNGGLVTSLINSGQQWDAPNGWAPLQWIAYKGLKNYQLNELAQSIAQRWLAINEQVYLHTGKMTEKYNVESKNGMAGGGEYPNQDGFGWTNGVYLAMAAQV
jgi:alpha,alpha-trehalase